MVRILFFCLLASILTPVYAVLNIEITGDTQGGQPIAIVPFQQVGGMAPRDNIAEIISNDLYRSGYFTPIKTFPELPGDIPQVNFPIWQATSVPHLVIGRIETSGAGSYTITFHLLDVFNGSQILGFKYSATPNTIRKVAHQISDKIYEALTGQMGAFNTNIAYVSMKRVNRKQSNYHLYIADVDGANPRELLNSREPIFSPTWSPNGQQLAYVSMQGKKFSVYIQDVYSGARRQVSSHPGLNSAPAWSPDGSRLALTLSKDGNPEIYTLQVQGGGLTRLTHNPAIDTEPEWSPDGQSIVFTSDRSGGPQLYRMSVNGGNAQRLTFDGNYNASAKFSPDGSQLALLHGGGGGYQIAVLNTSNGQLNILTRTTLDESPCFAPNGSMVIYGSGAHLAVVSVDGRVKQRLVEGGGQEVREAAWSPLIK